MFLTNTVNTQSKSLFEYNVELYEDIISFNEEYNNIKENIILQEHSMLLEGNSLNYIQESISETASKIWEHIKQFLIKLKNKIVEVWNIVKKKVLEIIVKLKSFFNKGEEVTVIDIKEDVSKLQRLRAYVSNIASVTKENIMEHKKEIAAIVGLVAVGAVTYIKLTSPNQREQELKTVTENNTISNVTDNLINKIKPENNTESAEDVKARVDFVSTTRTREQLLMNRIIGAAAYIKGVEGKTLANDASDFEKDDYRQGINYRNTHSKEEIRNMSKAQKNLISSLKQDRQNSITSGRLY